MTSRDDDRTLYQMAVQVVPGLLTARRREAPADAKLVLDPYFEECLRRDVTPLEGWLVFSRAALHWCESLVEALADEQQVPAEQVVRSMGLDALEWVSSRG